jgi:hypothetical protein
MRVAIVGGMERHEAALSRRAEQLGHTLEFHRGRMGGRGTEELAAIVARSDLVVIVTQVNSHGAMYVAKKLADRLGRPALVVRTCSVSGLGTLLQLSGAGPMGLAS